MSLNSRFRAAVAALSFTLAFAFTLPLAAQSKPGATAPAPAPAPTAAPLNEPAVASYVSSKLNKANLPYTDHASDAAGVQYLIEFDELILTIRKNHEFRASLRYRQTLASKGSQIARDPIQKKTVYGTWESSAGRIRFVPDPKRGGEGLRILDGTFTAGKIEVPFDYRNGSVSRRAEALLLRDDKIF